MAYESLLILSYAICFIEGEWIQKEERKSAMLLTNYMFPLFHCVFIFTFFFGFLLFLFLCAMTTILNADKMIANSTNYNLGSAYCLLKCPFELVRDHLGTSVTNF